MYRSVFLLLIKQFFFVLSVGVLLSSAQGREHYAHRAVLLRSLGDLLRSLGETLLYLLKISLILQ